MKRTVSNILSIALVIFLMIGVNPTANQTLATDQYNLTVTPDCGFNMLEWDNIPGAHSYWVYRGPGIGKEFSTPLTDFPISETEFKDTINIKNGQLCCYIVKAVNVDAEIITQTKEACATPNCYDEDECKLILKYQQDNMDYWVNDVIQTPMETPPINVDSRLFLVVRYVTQHINGTQILWDGATKTVSIITSDARKIELQIGNKDAKVNGQVIQIDPNNPGVVPFISEGRTMLPMRFIAENLGATGPNDVLWFGDTKIVELKFKDPLCDDCEWIGGEIIENTRIQSIKPMSLNLNTETKLKVRFKAKNGTQHLLFTKGDLLDEKDNSRTKLLSKFKGTCEVCISKGIIIKWRRVPDSTDPPEDKKGWLGAADSEYIGSELNQPPDINVSNTYPNISQQAGFVLDSSGKPHIAWAELIGVGKYDIYYVRWNGNSWVCADGTVYNPSTGNANVSQNPTFSSIIPTLRLDRNNKPHISWRGGYNHEIYETIPNFGIYYVRWDGNSWITKDGEVHNPSERNAFALSAGRETISTFSLDEHGNPHFVSRVAGAGSPSNSTTEYSGIAYNYWNGTEFSKSSWISFSGCVTTVLSIDIDSKNNPHISWTELGTGNREIFYVHKDGELWKCADGTEFNGGKWDNSNNFIPPNPSGNVSNTNGSSRFSEVKVDNNDNPHIVWEEYLSQGSINQEVMYLHHNNSNWICANDSSYTANPNNAIVSSTSGKSRVPSIFITKNDIPHISWSDEGEIFYV